MTQNLGGYCFEHNKLLHDALLSLGFDVRISVARVLNNTKVDSPKTHRITLLKFKGEEYLIDVGFGAMTPNIPLKISDKNINNNYKIVKKNKSNFTVETAKKDKFITLYTFSDAKYTEADCKMGNFYSEQHPDAVFQNNLVISLKKKNKILSYRNNSYHQISKKFTNILNVIDHNELQDILENDFGINISKKDIKILFKLAEEFRIA